MKAKYWIVLSIIALSSIKVQSQTISDAVKEQFSTTKKDVWQEAQVLLKLGYIDKAVQAYSIAIEYSKNHRSAGSGVDGTLLAEYAYVLALHHDYELALQNIDIARKIGTKYGDFYGSQILSVFGYEKASIQMGIDCKIPDWIVDIYQSLTKENTIPYNTPPDSPKKLLEYANMLGSDNQKIHAIVYFEDLLKKYPNSYIVYIDYSALWESLVRYPYAIQLLEQGIELMPHNMDNDSLRNVFQQHLVKLNNNVTTGQSGSLNKKLSSIDPPGMMIYGGTTISKDCFSINGRFGIFTQKKFSCAITLGISKAEEQTISNIGISAYKGWGIFIAGMGISAQLSEESNNFAFNPSLGLSFLDNNGSSSLDISIGWMIPLMSETESSNNYTISIGKTFYIKKKGE